MVVEIPLTQGYVTIVDDEDAEAVGAYKWHTIMAPSLGGTPYAHRKANRSGKGQHIWLSRWLIDAPKGLHVDHINRDTLDNRRCNLRLVTHSQNQANTVAKAGRYKGVSLTKSGVWLASIQFQKKGRHIGHFKTEEEAARA